MPDPAFPFAVLEQRPGVERAEYDRQSEARQVMFNDIPNAELIGHLVRQWIAPTATKHRLPSSVYTYGSPQESLNIHGSTGDGSLGLQAASLGKLFGLATEIPLGAAQSTLGHELAHWFQGSPQSVSPKWYNQRFGLTDPAVEAKMASGEFRATNGYSPASSPEGYFRSERELQASLVGLMMENLLAAKRENDYQTSIGLRPH